MMSSIASVDYVSCGRPLVRARRNQARAAWMPASKSGMPARRGVIRCSQAGLDMETMFRKEGAAALVLDRFLVLRNPIPSRGAYEGAIQEFASAATLAYSCGCSVDSLLNEMKASDFQNVAKNEPVLDQPILNDLSSMLYVAFMTLELMPKNPAKIRWTVNKSDDNDLSTPSADRVLLESWRGFVQLIVTAYYERRMSWYSIPKLQLEQQVSLGYAEPPSVCASRMRLVFTILQQITPQFPKL